MELGKIPPHDIDAEQAVLGSMLTDKEAVNAAIESLKEDAFYRDDNKIIYQAIEKKIPYCFCWANEPWTRAWDGCNGEVIMPQKYGGEAEWELHFQYLLPLLLYFRHLSLPTVQKQAAKTEKVIPLLAFVLW